MAKGKIVLEAADVLKRLLSRSKKSDAKASPSEIKRRIRALKEAEVKLRGAKVSGKRKVSGKLVKPKKPSSATSTKIAIKDSARKSLERYEKLKPGSLAQLKDKYHHLTKGDKRAERLKGSESEFYEVFKSEGMKPVSPTSTSKEAKKVLGLKGGGMTRQGLYPAEMARAGTMSQAKRKRYMKKGGKIIEAKEGTGKKTIKPKKIHWDDLSPDEKYDLEFPRDKLGRFKRITYKMTGGQVVSHGYD